MPEITNRVLRIFLNLTGTETDRSPLIQTEMVSAVAPAMITIGLDEILAFDVPLKLSVELSAILSDKVNSLCNHFFNRLRKRSEMISFSRFSEKFSFDLRSVLYSKLFRT